MNNEIQNCEVGKYYMFRAPHGSIDLVGKCCRSEITGNMFLMPYAGMAHLEVNDVIEIPAREELLAMREACPA